MVVIYSCLSYRTGLMSKSSKKKLRPYNSNKASGGQMHVHPLFASVYLGLRLGTKIFYFSYRTLEINNFTFDFRIILGHCNIPEID